MKFLTLLFLIAVATAAKVQVNAMVESLCPDCIRFWTNTMNTFMSLPDLYSYVNLTIYPYGKASIVTRDPPTFTCQHGQSECYGNFVLNCANKHLTEKVPEFFICMSKHYSYQDSDIKDCVAEIGAESSLVDTISTCAKGTEGPLLHLAAGDKTGSVWFVPYVTVNGEFIGTNTDLLAKFVCNAIEGDKPVICFTLNGGRKPTLRSPLEKASDFSARHGPKHEHDSVLTHEERMAIREKFHSMVDEMKQDNSLSHEEKVAKKSELRGTYRKLIVEAMQSKLDATSKDDAMYAKIQSAIERVQKFDDNHFGVHGHNKHMRIHQF